MSPFLRKVTTASGATAVQVVAKEGRRNKILEHLGSAHTEAELAALMKAGRDKINAGQEVLDLGLERDPQAAVVQSSRSRLLLDVLHAAWRRLGFAVIEDEAFFQLVAARLISPTSMLDSARVLAEVGIDPVHRSTMKRCLGRIQQAPELDLFSGPMRQVTKEVQLRVVAGKSEPSIRDSSSRPRSPTSPKLWVRVTSKPGCGR